MCNNCLLTTQNLFEGITISLSTALFLWVLRYFYVFYNTKRIAPLFKSINYIGYGLLERQIRINLKDSIKFIVVPDYDKIQGNLSITRNTITPNKFKIRYTTLIPKHMEENANWSGLIVVNTDDFLTGRITFSYDENSLYQDVGFKRLLIGNYKGEFLLFFISDNINVDKVKQNYGVEIFRKQDKKF